MDSAGEGEKFVDKVYGKDIDPIPLLKCLDCYADCRSFSLDFVKVWKTRKSLFEESKDTEDSYS